MKLSSVLPVGLLVLVAQAHGEVSLDGVLAKEDLWSLDQDAFQKSTPTMPFSWTSAARDSARAAGRQEMTLFGEKVYEILVRFDQGKVAGVTAFFYARGDAGTTLSEPAFEALREKAIDAITRHVRTKPTVRGKDATSAVRAEGLVWETPKSQYLLEYSYTKEVKSRNIPFRAEFIRLEVRPVQQKQGLLAAALAGTKSTKFNGAAHVKRDIVKGDVWLADVPMVDQGRKGYCVVASAERVMRYYGTDVDANELAQIANSDSSGTSVRAMRDSMKKVAARLKVRVRDHEVMEIKDLLEMIKDYNRIAKRSGAEEIPDPGLMIDIGDIFKRMNGTVLKEARTKNKSDFARFQREVQSHIDAGIPLLWSVQLGIIPEPDIPQSAGGHMRLIIGYNTKTQEMIFSDSWGAGHELKRMKTEDAWTITTGLMTVEPLS